MVFALEIQVAAGVRRWKYLHSEIRALDRLNVTYFFKRFQPDIAFALELEEIK